MSDTLVYKFGLPFGPVENEQMVYEQMAAAHRYRNLLTAAENERRAESREAERDFDLPRYELDFQQAKQELEDARDAVKLARAKASRPAKKGAKAKATRRVPKALTDRVAAAKEAKKAAQQAWHECRQRLAQNAAVAAKRDLINEKFGATTRKLRNESAEQNDLFWGTYLLVERAFKAACATPLYRKGEPSDVKRVFWDGEGQVGLQIQAARNFDLAKIFEPNTMVWISPVDERAWHSTSRSDQRKYARTTLHLRIASDDKRKPIWAHFPMIMHRPFPKNARLTWVSVNRIRIGPRWQWSVDFTLDTSLSPKFKTCGEGTVAVNLGWRLVPDGIRVATVLDDKGASEHILVDQDLLGALKVGDKLRSRRDLEFDEAKVALAEWLRQRSPADGIPGWMARSVYDKAGKRITLPQWRSEQRLAALCRRWKDNRFFNDSEGDQALADWKVQINEASRRRRRGENVPKPPVPEGLRGYAALEAWRYHDWHLWIWQESARKKALRRRKHVFRNVAAKLATRYESIVLHKMDMRDFQRRQAPETEQAENEAARSNRHLVAVAELRDCLVHAFQSRKGRVYYVPSEKITQTCSACGMEEPFDAAEDVVHTCGHCGAKWDQDVNACVNILSRHDPDKQPDQPPDPKPEGENRWTKIRKKAAERRARIEASAEV